MNIPRASSNRPLQWRFENKPRSRFMRIGLTCRWSFNIVAPVRLKRASLDLECTSERIGLAENYVRRLHRRSPFSAAVESFGPDAPRHGPRLLCRPAAGYWRRGDSGVDDSIRVQDESRRGVRIFARHAFR